jgi:hypothetical protein
METNSDPSTSSEPPPFKPFTLQVALRAIRRVHFEHQIFSLGRSGSTGDLPKLNMGEGIELAHEDHVRVTFVAEYKGSHLRAGWLEDRHYEIWQNQPFSIGGARPEFVDVVSRRYDPKFPEKYDWAIGPIELKRARRSTADTVEGQHRVSGARPKEVADDIVKLINIAKAIRDGNLSAEDPSGPNLLAINPKAKMHPHVLVWGDTRSDHPANEASTFIDDAFGKSGATRKSVDFAWLPLEWKDPPAGSVTRWLWVAFAEIYIDW